MSQVQGILLIKTNSKAEEKINESDIILNLKKKYKIN